MGVTARVYEIDNKRSPLPYATTVSSYKLPLGGSPLSHVIHASMVARVLVVQGSAAFDSCRSALHVS